MPSRTPRFAATTARAASAGARPLVVDAALASALAVATAVGLCMAVSLLGWFFADAGAHGSTVDALRVGGIAWILGLGGSADTSIGHIGLTPLGLTFIEVLVVVRFARWGWRRGQEAETVGNAQPTEDLPAAKTLWLALAAFVGTFVVLAILLLEVLDAPAVSPSLTAAFSAALLLSAAGGAWGALVESGQLQEVWLRLPELGRAIVRIGVQAALGLAAVAAVLVAVSLALSFSRAGDAYTGLKLGFGDALMLTLVCALSLPNAVGFAIAYLVGPGFAVGATTSVQVTTVTLISLPPFPTVAALPDTGPQPGWLVVLLVLPGLCALIPAARLQRELGEDEGWDRVVLRGLGGGALGGLAVTIFAALSGGALGSHRLADIGPSFWPVLVWAVGGMALGGALGSLGSAAWQGWRGRR